MLFTLRFAFAPSNVEMKQEGDMSFLCNVLSAYVQKAG